MWPLRVLADRCSVDRIERSLLRGGVGVVNLNTHLLGRQRTALAQRRCQLLRAAISCCTSACCAHAWHAVVPAVVSCCCRLHLLQHTQAEREGWKQQQHRRWKFMRPVCCNQLGSPRLRNAPRQPPKLFATSGCSAHCRTGACALRGLQRDFLAAAEVVRSAAVEARRSRSKL